MIVLKMPAIDILIVKLKTGQVCTPLSSLFLFPPRSPFILFHFRRTPFLFASPYACNKNIITVVIIKPFSSYDTEMASIKILQLSAKYPIDHLANHRPRPPYKTKEF